MLVSGLENDTDGWRGEGALGSQIGDEVGGHKETTGVTGDGAYNTGNERGIGEGDGGDRATEDGGGYGTDDCCSIVGFLELLIWSVIHVILDRF